MGMGDDGRQGCLMFNAIQVVVKEKTNWRNPHCSPISERAAGENGISELSPIVSTCGVFDKLVRPGAISTSRVKVRNKRLHQEILIDVSTFNERLGDADHHLRVIGVFENINGWGGQDLSRRTKAVVDRTAGHRFKGCPQRISNGLAEHAAAEPIEEGDGGWHRDWIIHCFRLAP